jgi:hypothetical protein
MKSGVTSVAYHLRQKALNLAHRHSARIHGDDLVVEAGEASLVFADELRLEFVLPIPRHLDAQRPVVGQNVLPLLPLR